jgi:fluoroacetyl-CoA thioesterase
MRVGTIRTGTQYEAEQIVTEDLTAVHLGSGSLRVYATPAMVLFIERTCSEMLARVIPETQSSVGVYISIKHLAPTPLGDRVRLKAEVVQVEGNLVSFELGVWDSKEKVGEAEHRRAVIDVERFLNRVRAKASKLDN